LGKRITVSIITAAVITAAAAGYFIILNLSVPPQLNVSPTTVPQTNESVSVDMASQEYHKFVGLTEQDRIQAAVRMTPEVKSMIMTEAARVTTGVKESMPAMGNQTIKVVKSGSIVGVNGHLAEGVAKILSLGRTEYLRFENFKVTNGPDLHVHLTSGSSGNIQNSKDLGLLKGSEGDQNYFLDSELSTKYDTVVISSLPFSVLFATGTLR